MDAQFVLVDGNHIISPEAQASLLVLLLLRKLTSLVWIAHSTVCPVLPNAIVLPVLWVELGLVDAAIIVDDSYCYTRVASSGVKQEPLI